MVIIDFQPVQVASIVSLERRELVANVVAVAKTARLYGLPIVLSTVNVATGRNQPTIRQLTEVLGDVEPIDRTSINAWEDVDFVAAVKATGRHKLIMVALWTEVCLVFPALDALRASASIISLLQNCFKPEFFNTIRQERTFALLLPWGLEATFLSLA